MLNKNKAIFTFQDFLLDVSQARLTHKGEVITLSPKAFSLLLLLVERSGQLVEKDEILRLLWPDSFVEEANLTVHMSALRKALTGPWGVKPDAQLIQTVPKRGYRFLGPVTIVIPETSPAPEPEQ